MTGGTLTSDERAVTPAITHVLTIAFTSILVITLLVAAGGYLDSEERSSARQELDAIGNRLADEIDRVDNLAQEGSRVSITTHHPAEITGGGYTVSHEPASACGLTRDNRSCLVLESHQTEATARVPVVNDTAVSVDHEGSGTFNLTADDPVSISTSEAATNQAGLNLRVGVASDIREDPLGSRLIERNVPPIPLFDVEPTPVTTAATHFLNGSASLDQDGNVTEHKWDIGDDGLYTKVGEIAPHWFDHPGKQEVTLRVADDAQDTASTTLTKNVTVSGLEYNHDLRSNSEHSIEFSLYNNWSRSVRLDSLFIDDLQDDVSEIGICEEDNDREDDDEFTGGDIDIDVDPVDSEEYHIDFHEDDDDCDSSVGLPDAGLTIDVDQALPNADTSAPDDVPIVGPGDDVTIQIDGLEPDLDDSEWRLGIAHLAGDNATETVFADRVGSPHVFGFTADGNGDEVTVNVTATESLDELSVSLDDPESATLDENDFVEESVPGDRVTYTATFSDLNSSTYQATLDQASADGTSAYDPPSSATAVAVDDGPDAVWATDSDWDNVTASSGVAHATFGDRDASEIGLGYRQSDAGGDNLTTYWPMDDDDGNTMSNAAFPGTDVGTTTDIFNRTVGLFGTSSYAFTEDSSRVAVDDTNAFSGGDNATITVSTWIHPREAIANSDGAAVIGKLNATQGGDWSIVVNDACPGYAEGGCDGTPTIGYYGGTESDEYALLHGPVTQPDAWHHVAFVLDGENDELDLYYDGRIVESVDGLPEYASANTSRDVVFGHHEGTGATYDGYVDETRIYDRALGSGDVQQLADTSTQGTFATDWANTSGTVTAGNLNLTTDTDLNGGSVVVRVETDEGELSDPVRLREDRSSYEISGLNTDAAGFRLEVTIESPSKNRSPRIDSMVVHERP